MLKPVILKPIETELVLKPGGEPESSFLLLHSYIESTKNWVESPKNMYPNQ